MSDDDQTTTEVPPRLVPVPEIDITRHPELQAWFEDRVVRAVRAERYCDQANKVMLRVFPDGPLDGQSFRDSDGVDCWDNRWRDRDGYDRHGLDSSGRDRDGYDRDGLGRDGYDRDGYDGVGLHRTDPRRFRFNDEGYDRDGFNAEGRDSAGRTREEVALEYIFDRDGNDPDGFNCEGFNAEREYSEEHNYDDDEDGRLRRAMTERLRELCRTYDGPAPLARAARGAREEEDRGQLQDTQPAQLPGPDLPE